MATLISQRLKHWSTDNDVFGLWKEALSDCSHPTLKRNRGPSPLDGTPVEGTDSLAASNAVRALRWARGVVMGMPSMHWNLLVLLLSLMI